MNIAAGSTVCVVGIFKDEEPFLDEWLLYHRLMGIDHFFLYDDHPDLPLESFLKPHASNVTVVKWHGQDRFLPGTMNQTKAYWHAVQNHVASFDWVSFLDGDEFIVLREHENVRAFLSEFEEDCVSVSLNWHVFGHNGHFGNPPGLITASLTRRMFQPSVNVKSITRSRSIAGIHSPHFCQLKYGKHVDANERPFQEELYSGRTSRAHINHYQCRSFTNWMNRSKRGDVNFDLENSPPEQRWRLTEESCLHHFVTTVALNKNEYVDEHMLRHKNSIEQAMRDLGR
jgi:hypothetical protein